MQSLHAANRMAWAEGCGVGLKALSVGAVSQLSPRSVNLVITRRRPAPAESRTAYFSLGVFGLTFRPRVDRVFKPQ